MLPINSARRHRLEGHNGNDNDFGAVRQRFPQKGTRVRDFLKKSYNEPSQRGIKRSKRISQVTGVKSHNVVFVKYIRFFIFTLEYTKAHGQVPTQAIEDDFIAISCHDSFGMQRAFWYSRCASFASAARWRV